MSDREVRYYSTPCFCGECFGRCPEHGWDGREDEDAKYGWEFLMLEPPWPVGHVGHWWSGWPGAYCMRCGSEDPEEVALADNHLECYPDENGDPVTKWDTPEHRMRAMAAMRCPADEKLAMEIYELPKVERVMAQRWYRHGDCSYVKTFKQYVEKFPDGEASLKVYEGGQLRPVREFFSEDLCGVLIDWKDKTGATFTIVEPGDWIVDHDDEEVGPVVVPDALFKHDYRKPGKKAIGEGEE